MDSQITSFSFRLYILCPAYQGIGILSCIWHLERSPVVDIIQPHICLLYAWNMICPISCIWEHVVPKLFVNDHTCIDTVADSTGSALKFGIILPTRGALLQPMWKMSWTMHLYTVQERYRSVKAPLSWNNNHGGTSMYVCLPDVWAEFPRKLVGCREPPMYESLCNTTASTWTLESSMLLYT